MVGYLPKVGYLYQSVSKIDIGTPRDLKVTLRVANIGSKVFILLFCNLAKQNQSKQPIDVLYGDDDLQAMNSALSTTISLSSPNFNSAISR